MREIILPEPKWDSNANKWVLRVQVDGKRKRFCSTRKSKLTGPAECRALARDWIENMEFDSEIRFGKAWEKFIEYYGQKNRETSTNVIHSRAKAHLLPELSSKILSDVRKCDWQACIDKAYRNGAKSLKTLKGLSGAITTFCKWAAARSYISDSQVPIYFDYPIGATTKEKHILQPDQLRMLFSKEAEDSFYIYCFRFIVLTGLRRGEFCALQTPRDFDGKKIMINESISHDGIITSGKTKQANREIVLMPLALEQIHNHRLQQNRQLHYLFGTQDGQRITPRILRNQWQKWREKHGIDLTLHELRHTFISYSRLKSSISLDDLKSLYGHSKAMDTDKVYVHDILLTPEELREKEKKEHELANEISNVFLTIIGDN